MESFSQAGVTCRTCHGMSFFENENGQLVCEQCGTVSEQSHQTQVEEDYTAILKNRYGVSVRRDDGKEKQKRKRRKKTTFLSLQHLLYIVQKLIMVQVNAVLPFVSCPEEYNNLCKQIWLKLILSTKPYLSTFTHIYPYTLRKPAPSEPPTPKRQKQPEISVPDIIPSSQLSQGDVFSGMEIPMFLKGFLPRIRSQTEELIEKSQKKSQRKRKGPTAKGTLLPMEDDHVLYWDDEEKVIYGREKVFSYTGYQLQLVSLIGILFAAARILRLDWVARDFELAILDGIIPYTNIVSFLSSEDREYVKPVLFWFTRGIIPCSDRIESEAWSICKEINVMYSTIPVIPVIHRLSTILEIAPEAVYLAKHILESEELEVLDIHRLTNEPMLLFHASNTEDLKLHRLDLETVSLGRLCEQSVNYIIAFLVLCSWIVKKTTPDSDHRIQSSQSIGFGLENSIHIPPSTNMMSSVSQDSFQIMLERFELILQDRREVFVSESSETNVSPHWESHITTNECDSSYGVFWGEQTYDWKSLSVERKQQVKRIGTIMGVSDVVLTSHIRSVEYLLSEREKRKDMKRKHRILSA